jgi:hypothetical protein
MLDSLFNDFLGDSVCALCEWSWILSTPHTHRPRRLQRHQEGAPSETSSNKLTFHKERASWL